MRRRRPVLQNAGAVACLLVLAAGCNGPVSVDAPTLDGSSATSCRQLVDALPDTVSDVERRETDPSDAYGAAWGDPPIVLRCGVRAPAGFDRFSTCQVTNGVAWFIPEEQVTGEPTEILMTTVDRRPRVEVRLPPEYFPPAAAMVNLAPAIKQHTEKTPVC